MIKLRTEYLKLGKQPFDVRDGPRWPVIDPCRYYFEKS